MATTQGEAAMGSKTPLMPALEALLQQTANVAANVSPALTLPRRRKEIKKKRKKRRKKKTLPLSLSLFLDLEAETSSSLS